MTGKKFSKAMVIVWLGVMLGTVQAGVATLEKPLVIKEKDSGKTFTVRVGQRFVVDLTLKGSHQVVAPEFNPSVLALVGQSLQSSVTNQGARARVIYDFVVREAGQTDLVIAVKVSGEQSEKPQALLKVKIVASGGGQRV